MARSAKRRLRAALSEARSLSRRAGPRLPAPGRAEVEAHRISAEGALASGDDARMTAAAAALEAAVALHLRAFRKHPAREYAEVITVAVLLALVIRAFFVEAYRIPSGSMAPTLLPGDVVLVWKAAYGVPHVHDRGSPARGDVIVFESPREPGRDYIKRVLGVAGDVITLEDEVVSLNGVPQPRAEVSPRWEFWDFRTDLAYWAPETGQVYLSELGGARHATLHKRLLPRRLREGPFTVPEGHVFVVGDNRDNSEDGRSDGGWYVPFEQVKGRAFAVAFSRGRGAGGGEQGGVRWPRLFRRVDGGIPQASEADLSTAAARARTTFVP